MTKPMPSGMPFTVIGAAPGQLTAVGGGTKSGLWTQIVSDITGLKQVIPTVTIGASFGDAMLAGRGVGLVPPDRLWSTPTETLVPDDRAAARYDELYRVYRLLYPATVEQAHDIARVQEETADTARR